MLETEFVRQKCLHVQCPGVIPAGALNFTPIRMAKDPAFLFYYQDFLVGTDDMTNEEVGAYIRCLCMQAAKRGISEDHMKNICKSHEIHTKIKKKFSVDDGSGLLTNERLKEEIEKRQKFVNSRSNNRLGKKKDKTYEKHMKNTSNSLEKHMENENENINTDNTVVDGSTNLLVPEMFSVFAEYFPDYPYDQSRDYPACLSLSRKIEDHKKWAKGSAVDVNKGDFLVMWGKIAYWGSKDTWFSGKDLTFWENNFQGLMQAYQKANKKPGLNSII